MQEKTDTAPLDKSATDSPVTGNGPKHAGAGRIPRGVLAPILWLAIPISAMMALEGCSSLMLVAREAALSVRPAKAEEVTTEYHSELGWIGKTSFSSPNLYGPGVSFHTNARRFRGTTEVSDSVPNGKRRLVCSGDSFTLGVGVADSDAWCAQLQRDDLETVNMGQGGYGIDQAYLWYMRDGQTLDHDIHLLSFVSHDFDRMAMSRFIGFGKPRLVVEADSLRVVGIPVPRRGRVPRMIRGLTGAVQGLRSTELVGHARRRVGRAVAAPRSGLDTIGTRNTIGTRTVFAKIVANLQRANDSKSSRLVLVYFPDVRDFASDAALAWRTEVRNIADSLGVPFVDLIPAIRKLREREARSLYIRASDKQQGAGFAGVGHFNVAGNQWAAREIRARLDSLRLLNPNAAVARAAR